MAERRNPRTRAERGRGRAEPGGKSAVVARDAVTTRGERASGIAPDETAWTIARLAAQDLNSSLRLEDVFRRIAERVRLVVDYQLFCVMLWNERRQLLEHSFSLHQGRPHELKGGFRLGQGISGHAASQRKPVRVADVTRDPRYLRHRHPEVEVRSELAIPLVSRDRLIGVLDLESTKLGAFTQAHEDLLKMLASTMATALENARLYERVLADERRLEAELATAREMQQGLLPARPPRTGGLDLGFAYAAARELGGDFYDFLPYGDGRLGLAIGDVSGKATPAALYGSMAVGMMRGHALRHPVGPAAMLRHMNEQLRRLKFEDKFLAMVFGVYDPRTRRLTIANAGLPWPRLVRGGRVERLAVVGTPLGLLPSSRYDELTVELEADDVVAFFSDGLQDCENAESEPYGDAGIEGLLARHARAGAQDIATRLHDAVAAHAGGGGALTDDCTAMVMKVATGR